MWQNSKTQIVTILKNSYCDKTQKLRLWQNFKNSNYDKTHKLKLWQSSKTRIVTKLRKLKWWQNSKTQIVTKLKKNSCDKNGKLKFWKTQPFNLGQSTNWNCDQTQKLKIVTKLKILSCDNTKSRGKLKFLYNFSVKTNWHIDNQGICSGQFFLQCFFNTPV